MWPVLFTLVSVLHPMRCGLPNIGNSCYINSAMQVMYHTDVIRNGVLAPDVAEYIKANVDETKMQLHVLEDVEEVYSDASSMTVSLSREIDDRKKAIDLTDPSDRSEAYNADSQLQSLIQRAAYFASIVSNINGMRKRILVLSLVASIGELFRAMDANTHASSLSTILQRLRSSILPLLGHGAVDEAGDSSEVVLTVLNCFSEIAPLESMCNSLVSTLASPHGIVRVPALSLDVLSKDETTLENLIAAYVDNTPDRDYADILYMAINRQQYIDNTYTKLCTPIRYPAVLDIDNNTYQLHSIIVHDGDSSGGHYYAVIKDLKTGSWTVYNDSSTTAVIASQVLNNYRRRITHVTYIRQRDFDIPTGCANSLYERDPVRNSRMYLLYLLLAVFMIY